MSGRASKLHRKHGCVYAVCTHSFIQELHGLYMAIMCMNCHGVHEHNEAGNAGTE